MNNHFAPFKPSQALCHYHLAENNPSLPPRLHYIVTGLMTASSVLAGFMFRPSPPFSLSQSALTSFCARSRLRLNVKAITHVHGGKCKVCSVDGETVPGMSVGSQWVVLPRYSCLFYKAVRSNEGLHTNTHSDTQTPPTHTQQRRKQARPFAPSMCTYVHVTKQTSV